MERVVQKIESRMPEKIQRLRVAAYGRVSSEKDSMHHSLAAQVSYYNRLIQNHNDWLYCGVYADEAMTGTKDNRTAFQRLLADCRAKKIDMVITKSVSRFARNTLTTLETIRELKSLGVDVYFEEQKIHSISSDGELLLTLLASMAQEESRSSSENVKWRIRHGFEQGELMTLRYLFGYTINKDGIIINESEAVIVREVFSRVIGGESLCSIARDLEQRNVPRFFGGHWYEGTIREMVSNEKYTGNAILQKTFINNYLEKKSVRNKGEYRQFYVEDSHPAIISVHTYEQAQRILSFIHNKQGSKTPQGTLFSGKVICGNCGRPYKRITVRGNKHYQCSTYLKEGKIACPAKRVPEEVLFAESAAILNVDIVNEETFNSTIDHLIAYSGNRLVFVFRDGHTEERIWKDISRANSWTDEMREKARDRALKQYGGNRDGESKSNCH